MRGGLEFESRGPRRQSVQPEPGSGAVFTRRLDGKSGAPIAVAFSGGPDSYLALTETLAATSRPVIALHVDHGLNPASGDWARTAEDLARDLGAGFRRLRWTGPRPVAGIPAAARAARHRLLAQAARDLGARVIVTGHTGDDALENAALGQGPLSEWSPSPVWPEGRGLMLLRPLLGLRRAEVRARLAALLPRLVDDPANADLHHPRIAVRATLAASPLLDAPPDPVTPDYRVEPGGVIRVWTVTPGFLASAMTCAGGGERVPRRAQVERLLARGAGTLAGARLMRDAQGYLIVRNAGEAARGGLAPIKLGSGEIGVFDGRYEIAAGEAVGVSALKGLAGRLPKAQQAALRGIPPAARSALPVVAVGNALSCPILADVPGVSCRSLVEGRLAAACGAIAHESGL